MQHHSLNDFYKQTLVDNRNEANSLMIMITLTDNAETQIRKLHSENATEEQHLRILVGAGGCSGFEYGMAFDEVKDGDHVLVNSEVNEHGKVFGEVENESQAPANDANGVKLLIDDTSLQYMRGSVIDFDGGLSGRGFEIQNPNATSSCGCGRSFN